MNLPKMFFRAIADGVQLGLRTVHWDEPVDPRALLLTELEAEEEVHPPRCNCFSPERVSEFVDTAIEELNDLIDRFIPDPPGGVVPSTTPPGPPTFTFDEYEDAAGAAAFLAAQLSASPERRAHYDRLSGRLLAAADATKGADA